MHFTATSSAGWGYRIIPTTITDDYVTGTLKGWGPHRGRVVDVPRDAVRTHAGYDMGQPITIYRTNITEHECICDHCRDAGTCFGCTSGHCP